MIDTTDPTLIAESKREIMRQVSDAEFMGWRHHPITAGFLQYLEDQIEVYRAGAADLVEGRLIKPVKEFIDQNLDAMSGQIYILRMLHGIEALNIRQFYGVEPALEEQADAGQ